MTKIFTEENIIELNEKLDNLKMGTFLLTKMFDNSNNDEGIKDVGHCLVLDGHSLILIDDIKKTIKIHFYYGLEPSFAIKIYNTICEIFDKGIIECDSSCFYDLENESLIFGDEAEEIYLKEITKQSVKEFLHIEKEKFNLMMMKAYNC